MTYKQQMQKAIKGYMKDIGFKYDAKLFSFYKFIDEDTDLMLIYSLTSHGFKEYYELGISASIVKKTWNYTLCEMTNGVINHNKYRSGLFHINCTNNPQRGYSMVFSGKREMKENMREFIGIVEMYAIPFWKKYINEDFLYADLISAAPQCCSSYGPFIKPLVCYMHKDYDRALEYAKIFLSEHKQEVKAKPHIEGLRKQLELYTTFYNNLRKLIKNQPDYRSESILDRIKNLTMVLQ